MIGMFGHTRRGTDRFVSNTMSRWFVKGPDSVRWRTKALSKKKGGTSTKMGRSSRDKFIVENLLRMDWWGLPQ